MKLSSLLGVAVLGLCSGDSMARESDEPTEVIRISCGVAVSEEELTEADRRESLRSYVSRIDAQTDLQIDDIEALVSSENVKPLRDGHYQWKRERDTYCWEIGRNDPDALAELECLEALTEGYYDQRDSELMHLEERQGAE